MIFLTLLPTGGDFFGRLAAGRHPTRDDASARQLNRTDRGGATFTEIPPRLLRTGCIRFEARAERVRRNLVQLARDYGRVTGDGVKLDLPLTHALLGEMIGSERETVTRAIDQLESAGFLSRQGSHYRLHVAPDALAR